jgi:hypothetical protein
MVMMRGERNVPGAAGAFAPEAAYLSASNPLTDPRFKIPGGQPWNKTPLLPGKDTKEFEKRPLDGPFRVPLAMDRIGNMGGMIAQINPTYPAGSPNYGQPMQVGGKPMSLSNSEYSWMQKMNELGRTNPDAYQKIKDMMGPYGWNNPPAGFQVPPGI